MSLLKTPGFKSKILFIVGPTASGKSDLAMKLAIELDGEIIAADSQTIRRGLDIGTAKPSKQDMLTVKHHIIDIIEPYEKFSVAEFKRLASIAIEEIINRGKIPIVVGGTGLYIDALFYDYSILSQDIKSRNKLKDKSVKELQDIITDRKLKMPENSQNPRHLVGVIARNGEESKNSTPITNGLIFGILPDDETIKQRINDRVEMMFQNGLIKEVENIINKYGPLPEKLDAIGYPIVAKYLNGSISLDEAKELFIRADWQYARRQKSWFKRNKHITWFESSEQVRKPIIELIKNS
jgi:tRNA dimethylallyltransferase